jgi:PadR family transcriptional regulator PadR
MLREKEWYGFELVQALGSIDGMVTGEGKVYPLLARLRRQGLVETSWQESATGPPRR